MSKAETTPIKVIDYLEDQFVSSNKPELLMQVTGFTLENGNGKIETRTIDDNKSHACFCRGPQNGEPLCPCRMRDVEIRNGRYIQKEIDLGPVK